MYYEKFSYEFVLGIIMYGYKSKYLGDRDRRIFGSRPVLDYVLRYHLKNQNNKKNQIKLIYSLLTKDIAINF